MSHTVYALTADHSESYCEGDDWIVLCSTEMEALAEAHRRTQKWVDEEIVGDEQFDVPPVEPGTGVVSRVKHPPSHPEQAWVNFYLDDREVDNDKTELLGYVIFKVECPDA